LKKLLESISLGLEVSFCERGHPLVVAAVVVARGVSLPGISISRRGELRGRWATLIRIASIHVGVRSIVTRTRAAAVRLVVAARRRVVIHRAATRRRVITASAVIVVVPSRRRRGALTVAVAVTATTLSAGTVAGPGGRSASVLVTTWGSIPTAGRPRPGAVTTGNVWLGIGNTGDTLTLELALVKLVYRSAKIGCRLELDKPFSVAIPTRLGVNHIAPRLPGKVLEVLKAEFL